MTGAPGIADYPAAENSGVELLGVEEDEAGGGP